MKVIAFNASAREDGNTAILIKQVFKELESLNIKTELIQLAAKKNLRLYWLRTMFHY